MYEREHCMSLKMVTINNPAKVGEILLFIDPDSDMGSAWEEVTFVPLGIEYEEGFEELNNEEKASFYNESIITLRDEVEALPAELYRIE